MREGGAEEEKEEGERKDIRASEAAGRPPPRCQRAFGSREAYTLKLNSDDHDRYITFATSLTYAPCKTVVCHPHN